MKWKSRKTLAEKKSGVRIFITIWAAIYVFLGSSLLIIAIFLGTLPDTKLQIAKDLFLTVLPVATGVITYWFASRPPSTRKKDENNGDNDHANGNKNADEINT